jgi:hypothetical protein
MALCCAGLIAEPGPQAGARLDEALVPTLTLDPEPPAWPDPEALLPNDEAGHE